MSRTERQPGRQQRARQNGESRQMLLIVGGVALVILLAVLLTVVIFFNKNRPGDGQGDNSGSGDVSGSVVEEKDYNTDEYTLDVEKYSSTILPVTDDAGEEYVKNTLFIGDSNTYRYMIYGKTTLANDIGITGMGMQNVLTEKCVKFKGYSEAVTIPEAVRIMQPQRIIIGFGTNNAGGSWTADYMTEQYGQILDAIEQAYPYADIIISAVPPVGRYHENQSITMTVIDSFNQALAELAEERGCKFLNTSEVLKDPDTGFAKDGYTVSDGIHLSQPAVNALFDYVRTHAYVTEDRRPTLTPVPDRDETQPYSITNERPYTNTVSGSGSSSKKEEGIEIVFSVNDSQMGELSGETKQIVPEGKECTTVKAVAKEGYTFAYWSCTVGRIEDVNSDTLTFVSPAGFGVEKVIVTANFVKSGYLIKVKSSDKTVGTAGIRDGSSLYTETNVERGKTVQLYARVNESYAGEYEFVGWSVRENNADVILSTQADFTYTPQASVEITAVFQHIAYTTNVRTDGTPGCSVDYSSSNGTLTVTATPAAGYVFRYWEVNGQNYDDKLTTTVPINQNLEVIAHFEAEQSSSSSTPAPDPTPSSSSSASSSSSSDTGTPLPPDPEPDPTPGSDGSRA